MIKCKLIVYLSLAILGFSACKNKLTKSELKEMTNLSKESDLGLAKYLWVDCDSIRKSLRMPVLGNDFYSLKKGHYRMWYNPDTTTIPRLISIIHLIEYIPIGTLKFNHEIGEIQLNDSLVLSYGFSMTSSGYCLVITDLKSARKTRKIIDLNRKQFDSVIDAFGANAILNY